MTPEQEREKLRVERAALDKSELFFHAMPKDSCEHDWSGPDVRIENGYARTCTKCGIDAMSHALRYSD